MPPPPKKPSPVAELPETVLLVIVSAPPGPALKTPPPNLAELPEIAQPITVKVPLAWLLMPPLVPPETLPFAMVRPEIVTVKLPILKMRNSGVPPAALRCTVNRFAPGPLIFRFLSMNNSAVVSVIALFAGREKLIVSPEIAVAIAWRSEQSAPGQVPPASAVLVTVKLAASADTAMRRAEIKPASEVRYRQRDFFIADTCLCPNEPFVRR